MMNYHELIDDFFAANYRKFVAVVSSARMFSLGGIEEMIRHAWVRDYDAEFLVFGIPAPSIKGFTELMKSLHLIPMEYAKHIKFIPLKPFPCDFDCGTHKVTIQPIERVNQHSIDWVPCILIHEKNSLASDPVRPGMGRDMYVIDAMNYREGLNKLDKALTSYLVEQGYDGTKDKCVILGRHNNEMIIYTRSELV
jgi:hypothetical protein